MATFCSKKSCRKLFSIEFILFLLYCYSYSVKFVLVLKIKSTTLSNKFKLPNLKSYTSHNC